MNKTFTFGKINNSSNNNIFGNIGSTNYSKALDDIILADIIDKNSYLFKDNTAAAIDAIADYIDTPKKSITYTFGKDLSAAAKFITNYKKYYKKINLPYILGKMYTLSDGTPIVFYDDEIQIGFDTYKYTDFADLLFLNTIKPKTKKIIIDIYINGAKNIDINIL